MGNFLYNKPHRWGLKYEPSSGLKKIGFWENNVLVTPKSSLKTADGQSTGCISGDCKNGFGKFVYNGGYYEGNFRNGYRHGYGKYYFDIGDFYEGNFKENKFNGKGTYYYTSGERYEGEWQDQRHHGFGVLFQSSGEYKDGYWNEGKYQGKDQKPAGYEVWVKNNYNNTVVAPGTTATNNKPPATSNIPTTQPSGNKPPAGNVSAGNPQGNKPPTTNAPAGSKPNNTNPTASGKPTNTNPAPSGNKPPTQQPSQSGGGFSLVDREFVKKGLALVIGNSKYRFITKLNNPANDVLAVSNQLKANGFDVITLYDGDRDAMIEAFMKFGERLQGYEVGLFYYSGHGVKYGSENYMVPVGANIRTPDDVSLSCLGLSNILSRMGKAFTKLNIVIVDACRTPFKDGRGSNDDFDPEPTLNSKTLPDETGIYFATSDGTPASDGLPGANGVYTGELVKYLKYMCQENVNVEDIFKRVLREVKTKSNKVQVPEAKSSITKNFYFQCKQ